MSVLRRGAGSAALDDLSWRVSELLKRLDCMVNDEELAAAVVLAGRALPEGYEGAARVLGNFEGVRSALAELTEGLCVLQVAAECGRDALREEWK